MQPGMQEGLVAGRSMRWRLGSQLASSGFTLSVCVCEFVHTCVRVVCEGSRSQSLILIWVSGIKLWSSGLAASTLPIEPSRRPISHRTLQTVQQDPAQPFTPPGEQARTILSPTEASKPSQKLDVA